EPLEDRQVHRQQGFTNVEAGVARLFQQDDLAAAPGEQGRGRAACGTASDDEDFAFTVFRHCVQTRLLMAWRDYLSTLNLRLMVPWARPAVAWAFLQMANVLRLVVVLPRYVGDPQALGAQAMRTLTMRACLIALALSASTGRQAFAAAVDVPFELCDGMLCLPVTLGDGNAHRMLLDTGNVNSWLTVRTAQAQGLKLDPIEQGG